jgi:hypothetical protein
MFRPLRRLLEPPQAMQKIEHPVPRLWDIVDERIFAFPLDVPLRLFYTAICAKRFALYDQTMVKNHG